jgi:hypothetical protein
MAGQLNDWRLRISDCGLLQLPIAVYLLYLVLNFTGFLSSPAAFEKLEGGSPAYSGRTRRLEREKKSKSFTAKTAKGAKRSLCSHLTHELQSSLQHRRSVFVDAERTLGAQLIVNILSALRVLRGSIFSHVLALRALTLMSDRLTRYLNRATSYTPGTFFMQVRTLSR